MHKDLGIFSQTFQGGDSGDLQGGHYGKLLPLNSYNLLYNL